MFYKILTYEFKTQIFWRGAAPSCRLLQLSSKIFFFNGIRDFVRLVKNFLNIYDLFHEFSGGKAIISENYSNRFG